MMVTVCVSGYTFEAVALEWFNKQCHTWVDQHAFGEGLCNTAEEFKAWSQNLGHEGALTTFFSYNEVGEHRQGEIIQKLIIKKPTAPISADEIAEAVARKLKESQ